MRGLNRDLLNVVSKVLDDPKPKAVHRLRSTVRRIESAVSYANPDIGKKEERSLEKLADLRKRAGKVRDFDVQEGLLDTLGNGSTVKDRKTLRELLEKKRDRRVKRLESTVKKLHHARFFARLDRIAEQAGVPHGGKNRPIAPLEEARAQLSKMAKDLESIQTMKPSRLHEVRMALKRIRYMAELAEESAEQKDLIRKLKFTQDTIGDWHDWQELTKSAEKSFSDRANCHLLHEARTVLSARHSDAVSAVHKLFSVTQEPARKPPRSAQTLQATARRSA